MRRKLTGLGIFILFMSITGSAFAEQVLISASIAGGDQSLVCACTNLTKKNIPLATTLTDYNNAQWGCKPALGIDPGKALVCTSQGALTPDLGGNCQVYRTDSRKITKQQVACTFSSLDSSGRSISVPVDRKFIRQVN